jgi:hypothetical protein
LRIIEVVCSDEEVHRMQLNKRQRSIAGFPEPSWGDVLQRGADWQPWTDQRLVIDSMRGIADTVALALDFLRS